MKGENVIWKQGFEVAGLGEVRTIAGEDSEVSVEKIIGDLEKVFLQFGESENPDMVVDGEGGHLNEDQRSVKS